MTTQAIYNSFLDSIQNDSINVVTGLFKHTELENTIELLELDTE